MKIVNIVLALAFPVQLPTVEGIPEREARAGFVALPDYPQTHLGQLREWSGGRYRTLTPERS